MKPITIAGGGLAGLSLGSSLIRNGIEVTIHEKRSYPIHRVCGEFISGVKPEILTSLKLHPHLVDSALVRKVSWFISEKKVLESVLDPKAYGISRYCLDHSLAKEFTDLGGTLCSSSTFKSISSPQEGLILATGKPSNKGGKWIGLSIHMEHTDIDHLEMHSGPEGYIGLSPIEKNRTNITGLFKRSTLQKGKGLQLITNYLQHNGLHSLVKRMKAWKLIENSFCAISGFDFGHFNKDDSLTLGDASRLIPPFVGNGMSMALESAAIAAPILTEYCENKLSWEQARETISEQTSKLFNNRMMIATHLHPVLLNNIGLKMISIASNSKLLPVKTLYKLTR